MLTKTKRLFFLSALILFVLFLTACGEKTLTFAGGEGATGTAPQSAAQKEGSQYTLPENSFVKEGYVFSCWTDGTNDYLPGSVYTVGTTEVTFTAKWVQVPTAISLDSNTSTIGLNGAKVGDEGFNIEATVTPAGASDELVWSSSSRNVATVANGDITPVSPGKATITATSKYNSDVKASFDIVIWPTESKKDVLLAADAKIKESIPQYICEDFDFDLLYPDLISYEFKSVGSDKVYEDATYDYDLASDAFDTKDVIKCTIKYDGTEIESYYNILIVGSATENDYIELEYAEDQLDTIFADYLADTKVTENLELPLSFADHPSISVQWASSNNSVINVETVLPEEGTSEPVNHSLGRYARPNDDTEVTLTATVSIIHEKVTIDDQGNNVTENVISNGITKNIVVKANGYSKEEKLAAIKAEVVPAAVSAGTIEMAHVSLPATDSKFMSTITWTSSDATKLSNDGKFLATATDEVTLTMKIVYTSVITAYSFEEEVVFPISLVLSENKAIVAAFRYQDTTEFKTLLATASYFPYGKAGRTGNKLELPTSFDYNNTTASLTWTCSEKGLFDNEWNLLKQYLRYHAVTLTATVKVGTDTSTFEIVSNVGIAQLLRTSHIAGCFSRLSQQGETKNPLICMDAMPIMSAFDAAVGNMCGSKYLGGYYCPINLITENDGSQHIYVGSNDVYDPKSVYASNFGSLGVGQTGGFAGYTYYYDFTDEETQEVTRFQYYFSEAFTWVVEDENVDANGDLVGTDLVEGENKFLSLAGRQHPQYGYIAIINNSTKDVKVPIFYYSTPNTVYSKCVNGETARDASVTYDGDEWGFVMNKDGEVIFGGETAPEDLPMYVTIPAGGFMWNAGGGQSDKFSSLVATYFLTPMCTVGQKVTIEKWDVHPFNSIIEYFKNDVTLPLPDKTGAPVVRNFWGY